MGGLRWHQGRRGDIDDHRFDAPVVRSVADGVDGGRVTLRQKQSLFVVLVTDLIRKAYALGFEVTLGEAWRSPEEAARLAKKTVGIAKSLHCDRLALDLNLFRDGTYLTTTAAHRPLGVWWEHQHPLCRWGGRFGDGNHYSLEHGGRT